MAQWKIENETRLTREEIKARLVQEQDKIFMLPRWEYLNKVCEVCGKKEKDGALLKHKDMMFFHYVCFRCVDKFFDSEIPTIQKNE